MDEIILSAKVGNWVVIKKMTVEEDTKKPEIANMLSNINETINRKGFEFLEIDTPAIDEYAGALTKGKRKGYGTLADVFSSLKNSEVKERLLKAVPEEKLLPATEAYFVRRILENVGYAFIPTHEILNKIYPELKLPKPKVKKTRKKKT